MMAGLSRVKLELPEDPQSLEVMLQEHRRVDLVLAVFWFYILDSRCKLGYKTLLQELRQQLAEPVSPSSTVAASDSQLSAAGLQTKPSGSAHVEPKEKPTSKGMCSSKSVCSDVHIMHAPRGGARGPLEGCLYGNIGC